MSGLTLQGFERKRLYDIKIDIENELKSKFGAHINLLPESVFGQLVGIKASLISSIWELAEAVYNSQYPDTAEGVSLDNVCALVGVQRLKAIKSRVVVYLTGDNGTLVPKGTIFSVNGNPNARFETLEDVVLTTSIPNGIVECDATEYGEIPAYANTLTIIETPVFGLNSVTNPEDAILGRNEETDAELRLRRSRSIQIAGAGTVEAMRAKLRALTDVTSVIVYENETFVEDEHGLPPKSFECVVAGGNVDDIANLIWQIKPAGVATYGNQSTLVIDSQGFEHTIKWSRPVEVEIYLTVNLTTTYEFSATEDEIKQAFVDWSIENLAVGDDVIVFPTLMCVLNQFQGITDVELFIGTSPNPTESNNIIIAPHEVAMFDTSRIEVNIT